MERKKRHRSPHLRGVERLPDDVLELLNAEESEAQKLTLCERRRVQRALRRCMDAVRKARQEYDSQLVAAAARHRRRARQAYLRPSAPTLAELLG
jgi:hypothetical protein